MAIRILSSESISGNITIHSPSNAPYIDFVENADTGDSKARITMNQIDTNNGTLIFATENAGTLTTALTISQSQNATFGGNVTLTTANTDTILTIGTSASGGIDWDIQSASSSSPYAQSAGDLLFRNASSNVLILGNNGSATFAGSVTGTVARFDTLNNNANSANIIYRSGTNTIVGNNASALVVQDGGNVGIGTTSPDYKLEVESTSDADLVSIKSTAIANNTQMRLGISGNDSVISGTGGSTGSLVFKTYGSERMRIDSSGLINFSKTATTATAVASINHASNNFLYINGGTEGASFGDKNQTTRVICYNNDYIRFDAAGSQRMRITSGGNVGIGTTSPSAPLEIAGVTNATDTGITIKNGSATRLRLFHNDSAGSSYLTSYRGVGAAQRLIIESGNDLNLSGGGGSAHMVIKTSGNVGIGTTSPATKLEIHGNNSARNTLQNILTINGGTSSNNVYSGFGMGLNFNGRDYSNQPRDYAYIYGVQEASSTSTPGGDPGFTSQLTFYTNTGGAVNTLPTQKMVITAAGNVGIGVTGPLSKLHVNGGNISIQNVDSSSPYTASGKLRFLGRYDRYLGGINTVNIGSYAEYDNGLDFYVQRDTFDAAGHFAMRINHLGNVGIGTTSPGSKLEIAGANSTTNATALFSIQKNEEGYGLFSGLYGSGASWLQSGTADGTTDYSIVMQPNGGNVGIGTTSPQAPLQVNADIYSIIRLGADYNYSENREWQFRTNTFGSGSWGGIALQQSTAQQGNTFATRFGVDINGNVGIGTTTPQTTLDVKGAASALNAHFGQGANNSSGVFGGISLGYSEAGNSLYRKVGIVAQAKGDGAARQDLHFLVDIATDGQSAGIGDSKMNIAYNTGYVKIGTGVPAQTLDVGGLVKHLGLDMSAGVQVDQITSITKTLNGALNTWHDTGIYGSDIGANGSYMIQIYNNVQQSGVSNYAMYWTGTMSWYYTGTNSVNTSEIYLNSAGHYRGMDLELRTISNPTGTTNPYMSIQFRSNQTLTNHPNFIFKFRRLM